MSRPNQALRPTGLPSLRSGKPAAELGRYAVGESTMTRVYVFTVLGLILLSGPSIATSCPSGQERSKAEEEIFSELISDQARSDVVDYVSFLQPSDNSDTCFVLVSIKDQGDCHACGATISIYELARSETKWQRTFEQRAALSMGSFGKAPEPTLLNLSGPVFQFELSGIHFGYIGNNLVLVAKVAGQFKEILNLQTHYDNSGSGDEETWEWNADVKFGDIKGGFPDIHVIYSGTEKLADKIEPVNKTELYRFIDQRYQRVEPPNTYKDSDVNRR